MISFYYLSYFCHSSKNAASPETIVDLTSQEKDAIQRALEKTHWNKTAVAKKPGLRLGQLRYRLEKLDID